MRIAVGNQDVLLSKSEKRAMVAWVDRGIGVTLHRSGGISFCGFPREGGTTIVWGRGLRAHMDEFATECKRTDLGPLTVYSGEDF